ncbi:DNA polymerase III subunit beta, partial [Candidatus Phytoplasma phoenicium]
MNFEIKTEIFLHYLLQIQRILPQKTFFPIYYSIKMETKGNILFLEVSNINVAVRIKIEEPSLKIKQEVNLLVSGKYFIDIIKKINFNIIQLASMENQFLVIKTELSEYKLKIMDLSNFPTINFDFDITKCFEIKSDLFKRIIKETNITASKDKQKIILTGVNFNYRNNFLTSSATDSFHFSQKKIELNLNHPDFDIVVPSKSLEELLKLLEQKKETNLKIFINEQKFFLCTNYLFFQTSLLEGKYPCIPNIKKTNFSFFFKLNKEILVKSLERVSLFLPKEGSFLNNRVNLRILKNKKIEISSYSEEIGKALEEIFLLDQNISEEVHVSFNVKYLEEILKVFSVK